MSRDITDDTRHNDAKREARACAITVEVAKDPAHFKDFLQRAAKHLNLGEVPADKDIQAGLLNIAATWLATKEMNEHKRTPPRELIDGLMRGFDYMDGKKSVPARG